MCTYNIPREREREREGGEREVLGDGTVQSPKYISEIFSNQDWSGFFGTIDREDKSYRFRTVIAYLLVETIMYVRPFVR